MKHKPLPSFLPSSPLSPGEQQPSLFLRLFQIYVYHYTSNKRCPFSSEWQWLSDHSSIWLASLVARLLHQNIIFNSYATQSSKNISLALYVRAYDHQLVRKDEPWINPDTFPCFLNNWMDISIAICFDNALFNYSRKRVIFPDDDSSSVSRVLRAD